MESGGRSAELGAVLSEDSEAFGLGEAVDEQVAVEVVQELSALGNRAAALAHADAHAERMRRELGVAPDARMQGLIHRLRNE